MDCLARSDLELTRRVDFFLKFDERGAETGSLIDSLVTVGQVGIFGGMLRDFARFGSELFASDVDLVVDCDPAKLRMLFADQQVERNRFGGYRLNGQHVKFDVWALQDTWAIKQGLIQASGLQDLTKTTFFDWDAAVYLPIERILYCEDNYFDRLGSGVVNINLEENPNPLGAIARTLRLLIDWEVALSQRLTDFLWKHIRTYDANDLVVAQKYTLGRVPVRRSSIATLQRRLSARDFFEQDFRYLRTKRPWF